MSARLSLIFHTVRYMTPRQWAYRVAFILRKRRKRRPVACTPHAVHPLPFPYGVRAAATPTLWEQARCICQNTFPTIGPSRVSFEGKIDWSLTGNRYRLECFRLNGFRFLLTLSDAWHHSGDWVWIDKGFSLMEDWWQQNGARIEGDKWDAYVTADRLGHWIGFVSTYGHYLPDEKRQAVYGQIGAQAHYLRRNVEYHLGANHLLSEARALAFSGAFLGDDALYEYGLRLLQKEYARQFLPDGGHYERSISYHVEALQQYLETAVLLCHRGDKRVQDFVQMMWRPFRFLQAVMKTDGSIPLVNDAARDYPFEASELLACMGHIWQIDEVLPPDGPYAQRWMAAWPEQIAAPSDQPMPGYIGGTGFFISKRMYGGQPQYVFFDAGDNGPDENPGHAHADALQVLWSVGQEPVLIDSGTYTYQPGGKRNTYRATRAHNTLEVDGQSSAEVWGAFRVARRGHSRIVQHQHTETHSLLCAEHDGYRRCLPKGPLHRRTVLMDQRFAGFAVVDEILCRPGQSHEVVSRYHLAPEQAAQLDGPCTAGLASRYKAYSTHPMQIVPCKVSRSFGIEEDAQCLEITFSAQGHTKTAAVFAVDSLCKATLTPNGQLTWQSATETETLDLFTLEREAFSP